MQSLATLIGVLGALAAAVGGYYEQKAQNEQTAKQLEEVARVVSVHVAAPAHPVEATQIDAMAKAIGEQAATLRSLDERSRRVDVNVAVLCASAGRRCER